MIYLLNWGCSNETNEISKSWTFKKIAWTLMDFVRKTGVQNFSNVLKPWTDW